MSDAAAIIGWFALVAGSAWWGRALVARGTGLRLGVPPLAAEAGGRLPWLLVAPLAVAAGVVVWGPRLAVAVPWRRLVWVAFAASGGWAVSLAASDGAHALVAPLLTRWDYLHDLPLVSSPGRFVRDFVSLVPTLAVHPSAHPPGLLLALWALARAGLRGPGVAAALVVAAGASAVPAALIAVRSVAGEARARQASVYLVLAPWAVWVATSADALFAGVAAWGIALLAVACRPSPARPDGPSADAAAGRPRLSDVAAAGSGLLLGAGLHLSYGLAPVAAAALGVALAARRLRPALVCVAAVAVVVAVFAAAGFWWPSGLAATTLRYRAGAAATRPYGYFLVANLAAFALATGPAAGAALARLRDPRLWAIAGPVLAVVAVADLSGMSKGEVERIWLPFVPWVLVACAALGVRGRAPRVWLAAQAATALVIQASVRTLW